jgi:hypothetical protein
MAEHNITVKLNDVEFRLLRELEEKLGSRTHVIRIALRELRKARGDYEAAAQAFIDQLKSKLPEEATLRFELDEQFDPFLTVDGERCEDIYVAGQVKTFEDQATGAGEDFVVVAIGDPASDIRILLGMLPLRTGVPLIVPLDELKADMRPRAVAYFAGHA